MINPVNNFALKHQQQRNKTNKKENNTYKNQKHEKLISPKAWHVRANFVNFGEAFHKPKNEEEANALLVDAAELRVKYVKTLSEYHPVNLFDVEPYSNTATDIALAIKADKKVNLVYGQGNMPELVAHSFAKKLKNKEFKKFDISPDNVEVLVLNTNELINNGKNMSKTLKLIDSSRVDNGKVLSVLFIKDFQNFISILEKYENPDAFFNSKGLGDNIAIVGFSREGIDLSSNKRNNDMLTGSLKKIELVDPTPKQTKALLKDEDFLRDIGKLRSVHTIKDEAIDEAVNVTQNMGGEYPGKAIELLKYAISDQEPGAESSTKTITAQSVKRVYEAHPDLKAIPASSSGRFKVIHNIETKLADVGGISSIKKEIKEDLLHPIKHPEIFKKQGVDIPKGFLLHGPPGTGKTYLAKAIAGEAEVPFIPVSGSEFVEQFVGVGAARVRELFGFARKQARKHETKTVIIFIDELDAVGKKRDGRGGGSDESEQTLNQLLVEMDGLQKDKDINVVLIGATNREDLIDPALKRPGRFGTGIKIPDPSNSVKARREILEIHAKNKPFKSDTRKKQLLDRAALASIGMSGADLSELLNIATRLTCRENRKHPYITPDDMLEAKLRIKYGPIMEDDSPESQQELVVAHECGHAISSLVMSDLFKGEDDFKQPSHQIDMITLDPRGNALGMVVYKEGQNPVSNFNSIMAKLVSAYGGYETEKNLFGVVSSGPQGDLQQITNITAEAITKWGLGPNTGKIAPVGNEITKGLYNEEIKKDIKLFTGTASEISAKIVDFHKDFVKIYVERFRANAGKGGNNLTGEAFRKMYEKWLDDSNKREDLKNLQQELKTILDKASKNEK